MSSRELNDRRCARPIIANDSVMPRRSALKKIFFGGAAGTIAISPVSLSSNSLFIEKANPYEMTSDDWKRFVGDKFLFRGPAFDDAKIIEKVCIALRLKKIVSGKLKSDLHRPANLRPTSISLLFETSTVIPNATYVMEHRDLEKSHLFLHQVVLDNRQVKTYEVVLN